MSGLGLMRILQKLQNLKICYQRETEFAKQANNFIIHISSGYIAEDMLLLKQIHSRAGKNAGSIIYSRISKKL